MKQVFKIGLIVFASLWMVLVSSCGNKEKEEPIAPIRSYIEGYIYPLSIHAWDRFSDIYGNIIWSVRLRSKYSYPIGTDKHRELSIFYGDTTFTPDKACDNAKGVDKSHSSLPFADRSPASTSRGWPFISISLPIVSIDAIAMDDYDEEHRAGSSLNDIFEVYYRDCVDHIKSGYDCAFYPWFIPYKSFSLLEFPEEPMHLVSVDFFYLRAMKKPQININHKIKIIYRFEDGAEVDGVLDTEKAYPSH